MTTGTGMTVTGSSEHHSLFTAQTLTLGRSSEEEETQGGDGDVPMDEDPSEGQTKPANKKTGDLSEYNLDNYDEDEDNEAELGPFTNVKGLTYYRNNEEDPYITLKDVSASIKPQHPHLLPILSLFNRTTKTTTNEGTSKSYPQTTS